MLQRWIVAAARRPGLLFLTSVAITVAFGLITVRGARIETNLDEYMPGDHPAFVYSDQAEEWFGITDGLILALHMPDGVVSGPGLSLVREITERLSADFEEIEPGDITSLYTAENIVSSEWGLEVRPFYTQTPQTREQLAAVEAAIVGNPMIMGRIVNDDLTATLIVVQLPDERRPADLHTRLTAWVDELQAERVTRTGIGAEGIVPHADAAGLGAAGSDAPVSAAAEMRIYVAGRPIVEGELAKLGPADMQRMAPLVILVTAVLLTILLRRFVDMLVNLWVVVASTVWSFGLMTVFGVPVYSVSTMIPVMLIAIGTAYGIHLHNSARRYANDHPHAATDEVVRHVVARMLRPVAMAALTTVIGFASLLTSEVLPVRYFGVFTGIGVALEMVLALLLVNAGFFVFGVPRARATRQQPAASVEKQTPPADVSGSSIQRTARVLLQRRGTILAVAVAVVAIAAWGATRVWIDTSFLANFQSQSDIVLTDTFVNDHFGGTSTLNIVIEADEPDAFKQPEALQLVDEVQRAVEEHPMVGTSFGLVDYLKRMHQVMHYDDPLFYAVPDSNDLIAQYLLLYEMSGDPENLNRVVDYDYMTANITVQIKSDSSAVMAEVLALVEPFVGRFEAVGLHVNYAGSGYKSLVFADLLLQGQMSSLAIAFGVVAVLLAFMFRSVVIGLVGTIPIAITAVVNFGVMGLLGIPLSSATAIISSIAIGIGVDYAIHLLERLRYTAIAPPVPLLPPHGGAVTRAADALSHTGTAILFNALAVAGGFAVLGWSLFPPNRQVGGLIALNMTTSAAATLTVLLVVSVGLQYKKQAMEDLK